MQTLRIKYLHSFLSGAWWSSALQQILRLAIVASILAISIYVLPRVSSRLTLLLFAAIVGSGGVMLLLRKPNLGLVAMIPACLVIPIEIGTGSNTGLHAGILLLLVLLGLWVLNDVVRFKVVRFVRSKPILPLQLLVLTAVLAFGIGQLHWFPVPAAPLPAQVGGLFVFVLSAGAFLLVAYQIREMYWLQWITWLFLGIGSLYVVSRIVPGTGSIISPLFRNGALGSLFWVWLIALSFSQALFDKHLPIGVRFGLLGLSIATMYVAYVQNNDWKSGWIPPLAVVAAIIGFRWWRLSLLGIGLSAIPAASIVAKVIASDYYSYFTRLEAWRVLLAIIEKNPILGLGPANYYWYTPLFPILGYYVQFNSHSQYIDLVAQTGVLGLFCFLWFAWAVGWLGIRLLKQAPEGFARAYVYGALGGLVGTMVAAALGDWVLPFVYNVGLPGMRASLPGWIFLGGLVAIEQMISQRHIVRNFKKISAVRP